MSILWRTSYSGDGNEQIGWVPLIHWLWGLEEAWGWEWELGEAWECGLAKGWEVNGEGKDNCES